MESRLETLLRALFLRKSEKPVDPPGKEDAAGGDKQQDEKPADADQSGERPRKPRKRRG